MPGPKGTVPHDSLAVAIEFEESESSGQAMTPAVDGCKSVALRNYWVLLINACYLFHGYVNKSSISSQLSIDYMIH